MKDLDALTHRIAGLVLKELGQQLPAVGPPNRRQRAERPVLYLTEQELQSLFRAVEAGRNARDLAIFEVAYGRGLRVSEVGLLQLSHLRLEVKRIYVARLKGGHSGEYLLTDRELKALRAYLRKRGRSPGPLFLSRQAEPICRRRLDQLMKYYGAAAGIPVEKRHFHCLRHSCATSLLSTHRQPIDKVKDILGHEDIRNTMIYAQITNAERIRTGEELQKVW